MNTETAELLCAINNEFYRVHGVSFAETRKAPWPGWERCLGFVNDLFVNKHQGSSTTEKLSVFDLACGNLRFAAFLRSALPKLPLTVYAVDNCDAMALLALEEMPWVNYQNLDVVKALQTGTSFNDQLSASVCDLSVSFGFMHHIPLQAYREEILLSLVQQTRPGGYVIVSFWQYLKNEVMAQKARDAHAKALRELGLLPGTQANAQPGAQPGAQPNAQPGTQLGSQLDPQELDDNDRLLGWENTPGAYRYCHSFSEAEIDQLSAAVTDKATVVAKFVSDGRTNDLNTYLVLRVL